MLAEVGVGLQAAFGLLMLSNIGLLAVERHRLSIRLIAIQGSLMGLMPLIMNTGAPTWNLFILTIIFFIIKGIVLPWVLRLTHAKLSRNTVIPPYLDYSYCVLLGLAGYAFSLWLASRLPTPANPLFLDFFPPAFATILTGLLLIVTRRTALGQVMGYLVTENGIYLMGLPMAQHDAVWIELSALLDVFVGVFVMGIAIYHISKEFDSIDVADITELRD